MLAVNALYEDALREFAGCLKAVRVLVRDGFVRVRRVRVGQAEQAAAEIIALMDILATPRAVLEEARTRVVAIQEMAKRLATEVPVEA